MSVDINSFDHGQLVDTDSLVRVYFSKIVKIAELTENVEAFLLGMKPYELDELEDAYRELEWCVQNKQYYQFLYRVEKAEVAIDREPDMAKRRYYIKKMGELVVQMEALRPVNSFLG